MVSWGSRTRCLIVSATLISAHGVKVASRDRDFVAPPPKNNAKPPAKNPMAALAAKMAQTAGNSAFQHHHITNTKVPPIHEITRQASLKMMQDKKAEAQHAGSPMKDNKVGNPYSIYDSVVMWTRSLLLYSGYFPMLVKLAADMLFVAESTDRRDKLSAVTPGNMDTVNPYVTFDSFCTGPDTSGSIPATWFDVAQDPAARNTLYGFSRISFCARKAQASDPCVNVSAWYLPANKSAETRPTIIFSHGLGVEGIYMDTMLPASLARNKLNYNALVLDYRNHGHSQDTNNHRSWGEPELRDLLGAIDCIKNGCSGTCPTPKTQIGLQGASAGAYQIYQALAVEPKIPGAWLSAGIFDLKAFGKHGISLIVPGLPDFIAQFISDAIYPFVLENGTQWGLSEEYMPTNLLGFDKHRKRTIFLTHASEDSYVPVEATERAEYSLLTRGFDVTKWIVKSPSPEEVTCKFKGDVQKYNSHVDSLLLNPIGYMYYMQDFWLDALGA